MSEKIKGILLSAVWLVHNRTGDVDTEDGSYATVSIESMVELEQKICDAFNTESDDVMYHEIEPKIKALQLFDR